VMMKKYLNVLPEVYSLDMDFFAVL
jgi:hypothetical protein